MSSGNNPSNAAAAKMEFVRQLKAAAHSLKTELVTMVEPDPRARVWWCVLNTIAALIDAQEEPINGKQRAFLKKELFGGMGSLIDFDSGLTPGLYAAFQAFEHLS